MQFRIEFFIESFYKNKIALSNNRESFNKILNNNVNVKWFLLMIINSKINLRRCIMSKKCLTLFLSLAIGLTSFQGCIGNFALSNNVLKLNQKVSNKFINEVLFIVLWIIPVYPITILVDILVINSIEFWTGKNPLAMGPGEIDTQYVSKNGVEYKIEATQNKFHIVQLEGPNKGDQADLIYNPETKTWLVGNGKEIRRAVQFLNDTDVKIFKKDGSFAVVNKEATSAEVYEALVK